jgi:hypothetical protein
VADCGGVSATGCQQTNIVGVDRVDVGIRAKAARSTTPDYLCAILDSGANENIFYDKSVGTNLVASKMGIETAKKGDSLDALDIGSVRGWNLSHSPASVFLDRVAFSDNVTENIISVGKVCDAGNVVVFDKSGTRIMSAVDFRVSGKVLHTEARDSVGMYPLTLKKAESGLMHPVALFPQGCYASQQRPAFSDEDVLGASAEHGFKIEQPDESVAALARTYRRDGMSLEEVWHAKLGHISAGKMKLLKLPDCKMPDKFRCIPCIHGKFHRNGHRRKRHLLQLSQMFVQDLADLCASSRLMVTVFFERARSLTCVARRKSFTSGVPLTTTTPTH